MFKKELEARLRDIFKVQKVSFNDPGEAVEQGVLFVQVERSKNNVRDGRVLSMVTGRCTIKGPSDQLTFGFLSKAIEQASPAQTKDLYFSALEENTTLYVNQVQLGFAFTYFFNSQYDPKIGTITSIDLDTEIT